jgi:gliding motility-associated-like protein
MNSLTIFKVFFVFIFLLITNSGFSNGLYENLTNSTKIINFSTLTVDGISPNSGHAGTVVTITGTNFTASSVVTLGTFSIPFANIQFVSATELKITVPCGVTSGYFSVDGFASAIVFNYIQPSITTSLSNLSYCLGSTVPQIVLAGTPAVATTPTSLAFSWVNTATAIGLIGNGVGNIPTFTAVNATLEPLIGTITVTPSINGCLGTSKSYTITVNPRPVATPISNISVCAGANINQINLTAISPNSGTGTSFAWSGTNNTAIGLSVSSGTTSPIPSFTAVNTVSSTLSSTFTVTPTFQGCVGIPINFNIQVAPVTLGVTDIPNQQICLGSTKTFGDPFVAGYTYSWSSDTGFTSILPQVSILFNQVVTQNYTYTVTNTATGCFSQDQFQIVVNPLPNASVITNTTICEGNSINIGSNSIIGSTYSWTSNPSVFLSINSNPSVTPAVSTTYLLEETVTATGCKKTNQVVITVQPIPVITIVGAPQFNICETTTQVQLNASIANSYASFTWTKVIGSGSFDNNTILNPIYSPSIADLALGSVTLRLSVIGANPCVATYTQDVVIIIDKKPIANAGLDAITCGTSPVQLNATGTLNATSLVWSLPTGITGSLNSSNPYIPIFTPSSNDVNYVGPITISLTASSNTTCPSSSDTVSVLITPAPVVDAGPPSASICQGSNYTVPVNSATAQNVVNSTILWTKGTGDGTIVGANSLTPTYIPGFNDIQNGTVTLTLSATGNNPCITPSTDSILITIIKNPIVNAGPDTLVCQGSINVNASIQNAGSILWTLQNGNGNFVDPTAISPIYIPAISDLNTTVTFSVTVTPINNCGPTVSDSVLYTINASPSIVVGGNATICQSNTTYQLQATATNTSTITWTSTGSGAFDNIYNEDPIYTLSPGDITAGSVTFTLTGTQSGCPNASDQLVLTIQKNPTANAGQAQVICQGDSVTIPGSSTNSNTFSWIRNGGTGNFINTNTTNPTYSSQLSESGTIYLTLIAGAIAPCTVSASSETTITIIPRATADAGLDAQICEGSTYQITTATASNNIGVQWSTNGDGTFTGGNTISPTYSPGPSDNNNGFVVLTLVATKNFPCNANAVDQMTLVINKIPVITVINPDIDMCVGDPFYIVTGVVPSNYDNLTWSTSGTGNFAPNTSAISPTYFPSASDYTLGTVTLTLTASRNPLNCNSSRSNAITLHFIKKPTVDAGPTSAIICEGSSYVTNQATAANYSNVTWSTSGTGTFTNATTLLATYTPSAADYNLGFVNLTLTANTITPCTGVVTDVVRLNLQKLPVITLSGISDSICITQNTYAIGGTSVVNYVLNSQIWTTSGTGTFSPSGDLLNPIYNPSVDDLNAGSVSLTITVNSIAPCVVPVSKSIVLNFQKAPVASAGPALTKCDTPFLINTATANLSTVSNLVWSTSGTGTFDYTNILAPIYTPSPFDVLNSPITLRLTANAIAPCTVPSVTTLQLTLVKSPIISVTNQLPICEDVTNVTVLGTSVSNYSSFVWSSSTGTTILNTTILNPIVTPSALDILNNQIVLTITAQPNAPCGLPVSKIVSIPIQKKPIVRAGTSDTICENSIILTSNAFSSDVTNLHWSNNGGDGLFTTSNLNTVTEYTPGVAEIASGQVLLTIIGDAIAPCSGTVSSTVTYSIVKNPIVTVNPTEVTICETQTSYTVPSSFVTLVNPSSILSYQWTTPNMAGLTGAGTWTPTYTPTAGDIATGYVYLTLTVNPIAPCATPIVKTFKINISKQAAITFTNDGYFCEGLNKPLTASFANHIPSSISWTIINGTGSLTGANTASPTYIPATDSGTVVIRISATSLAPCNNVVIQDFTITIVKKPIVSMTTILDTVCSSQLTYNLAGNTTLFANTIQWTRVNPVGTGTFSNSNLLNPVYTFNAADVNNGFVILRLTATSTSNCNLSDYKEIRINITQAPTVVTAPTDTVCEGSVYSTSATTTDSTSVLWTTVGTSNGLFTNANQLVTQYTPGSNDTTSFAIQITANGNTPCAPVTAVKTVTIQNNPILDAGLENRYNCSSLPYQITGVTGQNLGSILWTSNGSVPGTFSNPAGLNPTYIPSASELGAGLPIILTVTAQAVAPCTGFVTDFIVLNLTPNQVVNAGAYPTICEGASLNLTGSVTNASSFYWTTSGTGTFSYSNSLITTYIPSNSDIINTNVTLTLNAISNSNCPLVSDATLITIVKKPIATAGANVSICEGSSYTLAAGDATAQNYTSLSWTATGPGALNLGSINTLTPTYVPAPGQTGTVTLTLTAVGNSACGINSVSQKTITIVPQPFVSIPSSKIICEGSTLVISNTDASATDYSSLQWTSSNGLGTFSSTSTTATIYSPVTGQTGFVTLLLTATSLNGICPSYVSSLLLNIIAKPIVEAGTNGTICQTGTFTVSGASVQNASLYSWSLSGPAIIQAGTENTLTPVIVPNAGATGTITATLSATGNGICPVVITDFITIQINPIPVVNAGIDGSICEGTTSFQLNGTASNATNYSWTTTGGGTIQPTSNSLTPVYIPSASDYNTPTGIKVITFNLVATTTNGCSSATDSMQLTLNAKPKVNAGIDLLACQDSSSVLLNGATVSNYNSGYTVSWTSSGNGTWDYTGSNLGINPVYIFGSSDTPSVTLTMSALPIASCPQVPVTDSMVITINQNPTITVSSSTISMCGETFTMPDLVIVNNGNGILWTNTTGTSLPGILTNATSETPIFSPSANEIANGFVLLTVTATPQAGCYVPAVKVIRVNLQPKAVVNAGTNVTVCQGQTITINNGASVQNYATYSWSENGTGTIDPATINTLNPKYLPGIAETGVITLTLQATNLAPCIGTVSQIMTITILPQPTVNAGQDVIICQNSNYSLATATASNYTAVLWTSSQNSDGTSISGYTGGIFTNSSIINPTYTPSQADINLGYVYLTVKASNIGCNAIVSDVIKITISKAPIVAAGSNTIICEGTTFTLASATSVNTLSLVWTSSQNSNGTSTSTYVGGSFSSATALNPLYTPSIDDINLGHVYLNLSGAGDTNCPSSNSQILLNIVKRPTVSTTDVQMCANTPSVLLVGNATNYQSLNWSVYSGPGTISPNSLNPLNPTFTSGISGLTSASTTIVRLLVTPNPRCPSTTAVYSDLVITIQPLPSVEAGANGAVCYTAGQPIAPFTITGTNVTNASSQSWTTNGAGLFSLGTNTIYQSLANICRTDILTLTASGVGACSTTSVSDNVTLAINCTVASLGSISPAISTICQGATATFSVPLNPNILTYNWLVTSGTIVSGQGTNSIQVVFDGTISGNITVTGTNGCGSVAATMPITITTLPSGTSIVGPSTVCAGSINNVYTANTIPNATSYVWTLPNGNTITTSTNTLTIAFGVSETSGNLSVRGSNGCGLSAVSSAFPVTIVPKPTLSSTLTPSAICSGTLFSYTSTSATTGCTFSWTRAALSGISNPAVVVPSSGGINEVLNNTSTSAVSVIYQYTITTPEGCTNTQNVIVTVNPSPSITSSATPAAICSGSTFNYTPTSGSVGAITWVRNPISGIGVLATNSGSGAISEVLTNSSTSPITVVYNLNVPATANGCTNATPILLNVVVNPLPVFTVTNPAAVCSPSTVNITNATSGTLGLVYTYWNDSATTNSLANPGAISTTGTYYIKATNSFGCYTISAVVVIINPLPVFTVTNPAAVCSPSTVNITNATSGTPGLVYTYWNDSATTNSLANPTVIAVSGTYYIKATNSFGCYVVSPVVVTINSSPSLTSNPTPTPICSGSTFNYTPTSASVGTITWTRNLISGISNPAVGPSSGTINEVLNNTTTSPITVVYNLNIPATANGCTNATPIALNVVVNPLPVFTVTNPAAVCSPSTVNITNATSGTPGLVYSYWNDNVATNGIVNPSAIASSGTYYVKATNSFGCYTISPVVVTINPLPVFTVTNPAAVCSPSTVDITNTASGTPGLVYTYWNNNAGTIALTNPSAIAASGTYYIKAINSFGCSTIKPVVLVINPKPVATVTGTNNFVLCQNGTQPVVTFTGSNGTTPYAFSYQINSGPILTVTSLATSNSVAVAIPTTTAGNYTVTLLSIQDSSSSMCISNNITLPNLAFVLVQPIGTIIPVNQNIISQTVCQGTAIAPIVFNIGGAATNAFVTGLPAGLNGVYNIATSTLTISGTPLISGVFNYVVNTSGSSSGCNSTFGGTITVNSNDTITVLTASTINQSVCSNVAIQPIIYNLGGGATGGIVTFSPSTPIGISWVINSNIITISGASNTIGTFNYTVQSFGICGPSTVTGTITIKNNATVTLVSGNPSPTVCQGSSFVTPIQFSISPNTATMILSGVLPTGVTFNPVSGILSGTPSQSGLFPYTISSNTGCGNSISGAINVNPLQSISFVSGNTNQSACQYSSIDPINFVVSSGVNSVTVTPALPAGITYNLVGNTLTISGTPTVSTSLPSNYIITTQGACGPQATYSVTFDIRPEATIVFGLGSGSINQAVCQSSAIIPITFTIGGGATGIIIPTLPAGLTLTQVGGVYTIQGNPLISGVYNFPITTTGCPKTVFVTISNVNTAVGITLTSAVDTDNQILCQTNFNSPITPIIYTVIGASNVVVSSLPSGVSAVFSPSTGLLIISGTPTQSGVFNYTITSSPCSIVKTGVIKISTPIFLTNEVVTNVSCSSLNDGAISVTIVGGVSFNGQYAIRWTGPNGFQQNQTTITGLQAGQYVLTGTDAIGCSIPTRTYTILPAVPINISLVSSINVNCNGTLGCANFNITGGSGIYTLFTLQYLDPSSQVLVPILPANNNYYNICNLRAGRYYLTVRDSRNCTTSPPYLFNIYDYSSLSIETIIMDTNLCQDTPGNVRIKVNSLDTNLSFFYNSVLVPATYLGNSIYELSINNPTVPSGVIKVLNSQNCWVTTTVTTAIVTPNFTFTSSDFRAFGYYSVNGSVQFTNLVDMNNIPAEYNYVVWDFGDNTPFKVFRNPEDLVANAAGENFETVFHTYTTNGIYEVTLTVYNHFGCSRKITKTIVIGSGATMMLPTIFTPNGDGINDLFRPSILGLKDVSMFIYDGWGNVVYEVSSEVALLNSSWGWNGVEKGQSEPKNNDYRYYIIATTINDKKIEREGRFLLVK